MGNTHRPFYRVVVAASNRGRDGAAKEMIGHYNPVTQPKQVKIDKERALHWLMVGAQPTETVANLFKREGILDEYFAKRPAAKANYKFLDKTTGTMSKKSVVQEIAADPVVAQTMVEEPVSAPAVEEPAPSAEETEQQS